jgi:hypothetical protein
MHADSFQSPTTGADLSAAVPPAGPRYDIYLGIHKALRLFMSDTVAGLGRCDPRSDEDVEAALGQLETLLDTCSLHLADENAFIHPALEQVRPGFSTKIAGEHVEHQEAIADLRDLAGYVRAQPRDARSAALHRIYQATALFVAESFEHMNYEETEHNAVLWSGYDDEAILAIEHRIIASIPPAAMMVMTPWFIRALDAVALAGMLGAMRVGMPGPAFAAIMDVAAKVLPPARHATLLRDLGLA